MTDELSGFHADVSASTVPAVVLLTGAGETTAASWGPVCRMLESWIRVVAYRRTGGATSGGARSLDGYVTELEGVVAGETHPFVLVGHSFGGLLAQVYAERHPERVAGMVLVDATPRAVADSRAVAVGFAVSATMAAALRFTAQAGLPRLLLRMRALPLYPEQRRFERTATEAEVRAWRAAVLRDLRGPAVDELRSVIPSARAAEGLSGASALRPVPVELFTSNAYGKKWLAMHDAIAQRYAGSRRRYTGDRYHNIHMAHPERVAEAIREIVTVASA